eukprot:PhM_4_TR14096/c1_g2_i3/m.92297
MLACLTIVAMFFNGVFFADDALPPEERFRQTFFAILCMTVSAPIIVVLASYFFEKTPRSTYDARMWYVPEGSTQQDFEADSPSRCPAEILESRFTVEPSSSGEPVVLSEDQMKEVAKTFRQNNQALLYVSTLVAAHLEKDRERTCCDGESVKKSDKRDPTPSDESDAWSEELNDIMLEADLGTDFNGPYDSTPCTTGKGEFEPSSDPYDELEVSATVVSSISKKIRLAPHIIAKTLMNVTERTKSDPSDPFFIRNNANEEIAGLIRSMWALEARRPAWLLAIEAIKMREFRLAECLFDVALMLECPDIYFVLYAAEPPADLGAALEMISRTSLNTNVMTVARAWAQYYAAILIDLEPEDYGRASQHTEAATPVVISCLLGLDLSSSFTRLGGVPYSLSEETNGIDAVRIGERFNEFLQTSPVRAVHILRLIGFPMPPMHWDQCQTSHLCSQAL